MLIEILSFSCWCAWNSSAWQRKTSASRKEHDSSKSLSLHLKHCLSSSLLIVCTTTKSLHPFTTWTWLRESPTLNRESTMWGFLCRFLPLQCHFPVTSLPFTLLLLGTNRSHNFTWACVSKEPARFETPCLAKWILFQKLTLILSWRDLDHHHIWMRQSMSVASGFRVWEFGNQFNWVFFVLSEKQRWLRFHGWFWVLVWWRTAPDGGF